MRASPAVLFLFFLFFLVGAVVCDGDDSLIYRKLSTGWIRGRRTVTKRGVEGYVYQGIPYGEAPIGEQRLRIARPVKSWNGTLDTTKYKSSCMWNSSITHNIIEWDIMSENCLEINVFTSEHCLRSGNCSVAYYVHGGQWNFDSPMLLQEEYIVVSNFAPLNRSVVFVTVAYRLGSLGFANFNPAFKNLSVDLNLGVHDMILGLQWVQKEIFVFGGVPERVTLMGHSSGSCAVDMLTYSNATKGLFSQLLIMSGPALSYPLLADMNQNVTQELAIQLGCAKSAADFETFSGVEATIACYRSKTARQIVDAQRILEEREGFFFAGPVRDSGPNAVFPFGIDEMRAQKQAVPMLGGTVSKEMLDSKYLLKPDGSVDPVFLEWYCRKVVRTRGYHDEEATTSACVQEYNNASRCIYLYDDLGFWVSTHMSINDVVSKGAPGFLYEFTYDGIGNAFFLGPNIPQWTKEESPHHTQELVYIVGIHEGNFTAKDEIIRVKFSQLFADFINTGNPSSDENRWDPYDPVKNNYFEINFDENMTMPGMSDAYHQRAVDFWEVTMPKLAKGITPITSEVEFFNPDREIARNTIPAEALENFKNIIPYGNKKLTNPKDIPSDQSTNWSFFFWIAVIVAVVLGVALVFTCALFLYNRSKRRQYERLV
ncbi:hypothetical protein QR680_019111 [Steinernema hermaphroditum]|uniref:Carboxylic ester hydrolase n=1 Tax=Steinernema hermaphroditum TaxID=289476 RepID=A0AA39LRU8_9BILA|nr:hypothetical protein QR680_019111 [Steinernema hermaphroditum]